MFLSFVAERSFIMSRKLSVIRKRVAFVLSAMMLTVAMQVPVFAEEGGDTNERVNVIADKTEGDQDKEVTVGNVTVNDDEFHERDSAVNVYDNGLNVDVTTGNITNENTHNDAELGLLFSITDGGQAKINVNGDISSHEDGIFGGVTRDGAKAEVTVSGDVNGDKKGIFLRASADASTEVKVGGNVSGSKAALEVEQSDDSSNDIEVKGNLISSEGDGMRLKSTGENSNTVKVGGDVLGKEAGVVLESTGTGSNNVVVEGTINGGKIGVSIVEGSSPNPGTFTAWQIIPRENNGKEMVSSNEAFEQTIQYIIRVEETEGGTLTATKPDGSALATVTGVEGKSFEYALENDTVYLKIDLRKGYKIEGAFGDEGKSLPLAQDGNGNYYVVVPKGGGVSLSVKLSYHESSDDNTDNIDKVANSGALMQTVAGDPMYADMCPNALAILNSEPNACVSINVEAQEGLCSHVVKALSVRSDVTLNLIYVLDGVTFCTTIPAGSNLFPYTNGSGGASILMLSAVFGAVPI